MTTRKPSLAPEHFATYQVKVQGSLAPEWMQIYPEITVVFNGEVTTLDGIVADQSALRGLLGYLWDFNLTVLSVVLIPSAGKPLETGHLKERV
jgi:hypothetical protein